MAYSDKPIFGVTSVSCQGLCRYDGSLHIETIDSNFVAVTQLFIELGNPFG